MRINHNIASLNTYRQLSTNSANTNKSIEKLSSGLRINRAGDDAAGLAISEKMRGQIRGLDMAAKNAQDGISLIQTAEGALNETHSILQRMRELSVQSANDTNTDADRSELQKEVNQLADELNRIGNNTEFNTKTLLNGSLNKTEAVAAKYIGAAVSGAIEIRSTETKAAATGTVITPAVDIHGAKAGSMTGTTDLTNNANNDITADSNELTFKVNGSQYTIALAVNDYSDDAAGAAALVADINTKLSGAGAAVTASLDGNNLKFTTTGTGTGNTVEIVGGNAAGKLFGATPVRQDGIDANNVLQFELTNNGVVEGTKSITLSNKVYNTVDELVTELNNQFTAGTIAVTARNDGGKLVLEANDAGSDSSITNVRGSAASSLNLTNAAVTAGKDINNTISFKVDGSGTYTATIANGTYASRDVLAATIQNAINTASSGAEADITVKADGDRFVFESGTKGDSSKIIINTANADLGLTARTEQGDDAANVELSFAIGANEGQKMAFSIADMRAAALGITGTASGADTFTGVDGSTVDVNYSANSVKNGTATEYVLSVATAEDAMNSITVVDNAIRQVSAERSKLGAIQNRLEHTINNLNASSENLTAAESRVRDVDMAKEMMEQTKNNILAQAAQAMLAQANQQPQGVLQLLR